jgi:hypothetical protein
VAFLVNPFRSKMSEVLTNSSGELIPTNASENAIVEDIKKSNGSFAPALRRAQSIVTRILRRLESAPAPPGAPPDPTAVC